MSDPLKENSGVNGGWKPNAVATQVAKFFDRKIHVPISCCRISAEINKFRAKRKLKLGNAVSRVTGIARRSGHIAPLQSSLDSIHNGSAEEGIIYQQFLALGL